MFRFSFSDDKAAIARALERRVKEPYEKALYGHAGLCFALVTTACVVMLAPFPELLDWLAKLFQEHAEKSVLAAIAIKVVLLVFAGCALFGIFWKERQYRRIVGEKRSELVPLMLTAFRRSFTIYIGELIVTLFGVEYFKLDFQSKSCFVARILSAIVYVGVAILSERCPDVRELRAERKALRNNPPTEVQTYLLILPASLMTIFMAPLMLLFFGMMEAVWPSLNGEKLSSGSLAMAYLLYASMNLVLAGVLLLSLKRDSQNGKLKSDVFRYYGDLRKCWMRALVATGCGCVAILALIAGEKTGFFATEKGATGMTLAEARVVSGVFLFGVGVLLQYQIPALIGLLRKLRIPEQAVLLNDPSSASP